MNEEFEGFGVFFFLDGFGEGVGGIILIYLCGDLCLELLEKLVKVYWKFVHLFLQCFLFFYLVRELHICENNLHEFIYGNVRLLYYQVKLDT